MREVKATCVNFVLSVLSIHRHIRLSVSLFSNYISPSYIPYEFIFYSEEGSRTLLLNVAEFNYRVLYRLPEHNLQCPF